MDLVENRVIGKNSCYPIEDCLDICQEHKQTEAVFLLSIKLNKYFDAVGLGAQVLKENVDYQKLLVELYYCHKNGISTSLSSQVLKSSAKKVADPLDLSEDKSLKVSV
jgi:hypothetical protein